MDEKVLLVTELKQLRKKVGLTADHLQDCPTLLRHLREADELTETTVERLKRFARMIGDEEERDGVLNILGITGKQERSVGVRRRRLAVGRSQATVLRRENAGFEDLARIVLENSVYKEESVIETTPVQLNELFEEDMPPSVFQRFSEFTVGWTVAIPCLCVIAVVLAAQGGHPA